MSLFVAYILIFSATAYEGQGLLNKVIIGKDYKIGDVNEIKNFTALAYDDKDDLDFILTLDSEVKLEHPDGGLLPTLILLKGGKIMASIHLRVSRWEKENELILQWSAVPDFDIDSYCIIQMYPNSEKIVTLQIPFSAATVKRAKEGRSVGEPLEIMTMDEFRKEFVERSGEKKPEQDPPGRIPYH